MRKGATVSPGSLDLDVVLRHESFLSVYLSFAPVVQRAENLKRDTERRGERRAPRAGAAPASHAHLQDVAFPEAELGVVGAREVVLSPSFHQDGAAPTKM